MKVLILVGSLRKASFGRKLAQSVKAIAPDTMTFEEIDGRDVPLYNQDLDGDEKPPAVRELIAQISHSDALVFVTPEFNYGIPASLKNAIDWASRPAFRSPLKNKPALVMAYSPAPTGGARVHTQLSAVLAGTLTPLLNAPGFLVPSVHEKFDASDELTDEATQRRLDRTLQDFADWAKSLHE
jgi:chromate reductase